MERGTAVRSKKASRLALCAALLCLTALGSAAQDVEIARVKDSLEVFRALTLVPEHEVPGYLLRGAQGIAIIPGVRRVGLVIGGEKGQGVLVVRTPAGWSRSVFISLRGGSIGWQIGIQSADVVLFFRTRDSVDRILAGKFALGVDASVAAGSLGREASAVTDTDMQAEVYSYSRARGIFAGLALKGAALEIDGKAASLYYRRDLPRAEDVFEAKNLPDPQSAVELMRGIAELEKSIK
jgi:lipid-binding SYLF domain-containing protein